MELATCTSSIIIMRVSVLDVKEQVLTKAVRVVGVMELDIGTSTMVGDNKEGKMKHRHIHAKKGEWIHVHRDNNSGCLGIVIAIIIIGLIMSGC